MILTNQVREVSGKLYKYKVFLNEWVDSLEGNSRIVIEGRCKGMTLSMDCFWCEVASGELKLLEAEAARWLTKEELDSVQWLPADVTLIDKIRKCME